MKKILYIICAISAICGFTACNSFLDEHTPQGVLSDDQVKTPENAEAMVVSAYAIFTSAEDINSSFSMWNFDVRSDDAYKGGNGTSDGDVFHQLEVQQGVLTTNWNINDMWVRLYNCISRVNSAIALLNTTGDDFNMKSQRLAEMKFLRAYAHFLLKRLYKNIPFVVDENLTYQQYNELSNTEYTNDEGWQVIIDDLMEAYNTLPVTQQDKGRPTKAAAAAFLAKVYLYKAYHQDNENSNQVTSINEADLQKVVDYTNLSIYSAAGYGLEADLHNNFRPEEEYENGKESIWAIQYSKNDGTEYGNLNFANRLIVPCIPKVHDSGNDFYKPSQSLVNAYRTSTDGLPLADNTTAADYAVGSTQTVDPRLFVTAGIPGTPYMFNASYMIEKSNTWSRAGEGTYGYNVSLKQNVDPALTNIYLYNCDNQWASSMNRIVFRYADVLLMRAEALAQLNKTAEAISLVNQVRERASKMATSSIVANYTSKYGVHYFVKTYNGSYSKDEAIKIVKTERRLELAMESERFFDLVRWGDAATVLNKYYAEEGKKMLFLAEGHFTSDKNEYLPIPY